MLPTRAELVAAYEFYARRHQLEKKAAEAPIPIERPLRARPAAVDAALATADEAVRQGYDEVAAVLFGFATHPRSFPFAVYGFVAVITMNVARSTARRLNASTADYRDIINRVMHREASITDVETWVVRRLEDSD